MTLLAQQTGFLRLEDSSQSENVVKKFHLHRRSIDKISYRFVLPPISGHVKFIWEDTI